MKIALVLLPILMTISTLATTAVAIGPDANSLIFRFLGDAKWELDRNVRNDFLTFLNHEKQSLMVQIPGLEFPAEFPSLRETLSSYAVADSKAYKNRAMSCSFLAKVKANLTSDSDRIEFNGITHDGEVCIPRDIEAADLSSWSLRLMHFLWERNWIPDGGTTVSLEQYLKIRLQISNYVRPQLKIFTAVDFDGFGSSLSTQDLKVIAESETLSSIFGITKNFDINDLESLGDLGPQLAQKMQIDRYTTAELFSTVPVIYITRNWAPGDMVETLVHEYGHVYHGSFKNVFKDRGSVIEITGSPLLNEGVAEGLTWFALCPLYGDFPELKLFHILKLLTFSEIEARKEDPHWVGAAAFADKFHYKCPSSSEGLHELLAAKSIDDFMLKTGNYPLKQIGSLPDEDVQLMW